MIELPELAKSYRREPIKQSFRAYVPVETWEASERRLMLEAWDRDFSETYVEQLKQYMLSNLVREIGLHHEDIH